MPSSLPIRIYKEVREAVRTPGSLQYVGMPYKRWREDVYPSKKGNGVEGKTRALTTLTRELGALSAVSSQKVPQVFVSWFLTSVNVLRWGDWGNGGGEKEGLVFCNIAYHIISMAITSEQFGLQMA